MLVSETPTSSWLWFISKSFLFQLLWLHYPPFFLPSTYWYKWANPFSPSVCVYSFRLKNFFSRSLKLSSNKKETPRSKKKHEAQKEAKFPRHSPGNNPLNVAKIFTFSTDFFAIPCCLTWTFLLRLKPDRIGLVERHQMPLLSIINQIPKLVIIAVYHV